MNLQKSRCRPASHPALREKPDGGGVAAQRRHLEAAGLGLMGEAALGYVDGFLVDNKVLKEPIGIAKAVDMRLWSAAPDAAEEM